MLEALILGIVQGLTEFLPVSSTAHLILFPWFFKWSGLVDTLTFDVALHAGTLLALLICFWRDWVDILLRKRGLLWLLVLASLPAGVAGVLLNHLIEEKLRSPLIIAASLTVVGFVMLAAEKMFRHKKLEDISLMDSVVIGLSQAIALIPGVSRSGITISAGLFRGIDREAAARFSFLLSTPVIAGATLLHARKLFSGHTDYDMEVVAAGFIAAAVTGYLAIRFLLYFLRRHPLNIFAYYRFLLSAFIVGLWLKG